LNKTLSGALVAGIGGIVGALILASAASDPILASAASDPPNDIVIQGKNVTPKIYRANVIGDGLTTNTAFRPEVVDDLAGKPHQIKWDRVSGQVVVWCESSRHTVLEEKHELLGTP